MDSLLDTQRVYYEGQNEKPPPMIPHGIDPKTIRPNLKRRSVPRDHTTLIPSRPQLVPEEVKPITASDLPEGFPAELAYRALAVYSLLRTLSVELRLAPFTPNVFLRALYLPFPNRLLGKIHVSLLRILLTNLQLGYHWHDKTPPMDVVKKRLVDGLKWPLRAGDCFRLLDTYTWPIFYDDYCHLTADIIHASLHDKTDFAEQRSLDTSGILSETDRRFTNTHVFSHNGSLPDVTHIAGRTTKLETLYLNASESDESSVEEEYDDNEGKDDGDDDEDDDYVDKSDTGLKKNRKGNARKYNCGIYEIGDKRNSNPNVSSVSI
jgi:DDT domain